jgi:hypothetical protein
MSELATLARTAPVTAARGEGATHPLLAELLRAADDRAPALTPDEVLFVRTERHLVGKYAFLRGAGLRTLDLFELREAGHGSPLGRLRAARAARAEIERLRGTGELRGIRAVLFDVSEAWFATSLFYSIRKLLPAVATLGVQHGVMELSGLEGTTAVRRLRQVATRTQHAIFGGAFVGGGFGNAPFDAYVCYGATYRRYIHRVQPRTRVLVNFGDLTPVDRRAAAERELPFDILFLGQDLSIYRVADQGAVYRSVFRRIDEVASGRGLRVVVKLHPKQELDPALAAEFPRFEFVRQGPLHEMLSARLRAVISFNSTGLLEAAVVGAPMVAIRIPRIHSKWYDSFESTVDLDAFAASWDLGVSSRVRAGEME